LNWSAPRIAIFTAKTQSSRRIFTDKKGKWLCVLCAFAVNELDYR
jgi:hypothetical protein